MYTSTLSKTLVIAAVCFLGVNSAPTLEARDPKPLIPFQASEVQSSAYTHQTRGPGVDRKAKFEAALSACGATPTGGSSNGGNVAQTSVAGGPVATSSSLARSRRSIKNARESEPVKERREAEAVKERREPQPDPAAEFEIIAREWSEGYVFPLLKQVPVMKQANVVCCLQATHPRFYCLSMDS